MMDYLHQYRDCHRGYRRVVAAAEVHGLLLLSVSDLHGSDLCKQLHLSLPISPTKEFELAVKLTQALTPGFKAKHFRFKHREK